MSIGELGMRNVVSLQCDSEREVSHGSHRSHGSSSLQATGILIWSLNGRTPQGVKIREIREIRVGKIQHLTFKINHHESKLEIRHQFRHHCPHRRPQLLLHAELQMIASEHELHESNESYLFKGHIRVIREIRVQLNQNTLRSYSNPSEWPKL